MADEEFDQIKGEEEEEVIGPCAVLLCGFDHSELAPVGMLLDRIGVDSCRVLFCTQDMLEQPLEQAFRNDTHNPPVPPDKLPRTMVLSGMKPSQLQQVVVMFAATGLPRPIFASATHTNLAFTVKDLLVELLREHRAMQQKKMAKKLDPFRDPGEEEDDKFD